MATWLEGVLASCHDTNAPRVRNELDLARRGSGPTLFDMIVEIIRLPGPGGVEAKSGIDLELM